MDKYIAELDETKHIAAVWVKKKNARGPSVIKPGKNIIEPRMSDEFVGATRDDIVSWINVRKQTT